MVMVLVLYIARRWIIRLESDHGRSLIRQLTEVSTWKAIDSREMATFWVANYHHFSPTMIATPHSTCGATTEPGWFTTMVCFFRPRAARARNREHY